MKVATKPILFSELCKRAQLRQADIVRRSGLSTPTVQNIMRGKKVAERSLRDALEVVNAKLHTTYIVDDIALAEVVEIEVNEDGK